MDSICATSGLSYNNLSHVLFHTLPVLADLLWQGQPTVPCKGQMVNVLGFVRHPVPVATMKAATDNMQNMEMAAFQ